MHARTIAALLMSTIEEAMNDTPFGESTINSFESGESGSIASLAGLHFPGGPDAQASFNLVLEDKSQFRIDVIRIR